MEEEDELRLENISKASGSEILNGSEEFRWSQDNEEDEFGDFEASESWSSPVPSILSVQDLIRSVEPNVTSVISAHFPSSPVESEETHPQSEDFSDSTWSKLQCVESSPSLNFSWNNSKSNSLLMASLRIDSRNILFDGKWKTKNLPSFMDSSSQLLEPTKVEGTLSTSQRSSPTSEDQPVPPVEFDWKTSCLVDPLDSNQGITSAIDFLLTTSYCSIQPSMKDLQRFYEFPRTIHSPSGSTENCSSLKMKKSDKSAGIVDSFPLLNFMQSSTLIFPLNGCDSKL